MVSFSRLLVMTSFLAFCSERYRLKFADTYRLFLFLSIIKFTTRVGSQFPGPVQLC
jgi:hypothetical protein